MNYSNRFLLLCSLGSALMLAGCDDMPEWIGGGADKPPLEGKRVAVLSDVAQAKVDESAANVAIALPEPVKNASWQAQGGSASGLTGNLAWTGHQHHDNVSAGDGNAWKHYSNASPVIADGVVYAMDAHGFISAHDAVNISHVKWTSKELVEKDEPDVMGGGVAVEGSRVYVTTGYGKVAALDSATGKKLWVVTLGIPLRNPPKVSGSKVFVLSADNQLFVLDGISGAQLWNHRGITENVGFFTSVSPSAKDTVVIAPYSSGEIHALDASSGQEIWNDTLILSRHTTATGGFSGIGGAPVVADDVVYAGDSGGFFAAITLLSGRRVWEQDIPSLNPAWVAGDAVYLLSDTNQLVCLLKADGRVKWARQLPSYENEAKRKGAYVWRGPIMAGGQLLVTGQHGEMLALSPKDGATTATVSIPENITNTPVVAGGVVYFITQDGKLHALY